MFDDLQSRVKSSAARAGRTAAIGLSAALSLCVGLAFLTLSAWMFLVSVTEPMIAALIIGGFYTGGSIVALALLASGGEKTKPRETTPPPASQEEPLPPLAEAFIIGLRAGAKSRS